MGVSCPLYNIRSPISWLTDFWHSGPRCSISKMWVFDNTSLLILDITFCTMSRLISIEMTWYVWRGGPKQSLEWPHCVSIDIILSPPSLKVYSWDLSPVIPVRKWSVIPLQLSKNVETYISCRLMGDDIEIKQLILISISLHGSMKQLI